MSRRMFSPARLATVGVVLLAAVVIVLLTKQSDKFLEVPDKAHPLAGLVRVSDSTKKPDEGGIYYVDVKIQRASLLQASFGLFRPEGSDLIPQQAFVPCGISYSQNLALEGQTMKLSQQTASAVALRSLGYKVRAQDVGVRVVAVDPRSHAHGVLEAGDVVVAANGRKVHDRLDLFRVISRAKVGDVVRMTVRRDGKLQTLRVRTIADRCSQQQRAIVGFIPFDAVDIRLPVKIRFNLRDVGGPSAGLAFALEVLEQRGRDVDHGLKVAATGEIGLDGSVTQIGGIKQKTIGARQAGVDAFLVPVDGDNAKEAKRYAKGLRIIPVKTFQQALQSLATLRAKA
jgi:PDZ domain-containing protein